MESFDTQINNWIQHNQLVFITILKIKEERKSVWGRIIRLDKENNNLLVYVDDEKKTYDYSLNEIEDIKAIKK